MATPDEVQELGFKCWFDRPWSVSACDGEIEILDAHNDVVLSWKPETEEGHVFLEDADLQLIVAAVNAMAPFNTRGEMEAHGSGEGGADAGV